MFLISKLLQQLTQPLVWVLLALALAWWWLPRRPQAARRLLAASVAAVLLLGWVPLPDFWLRALEQQVPAPAAPGDARWAGYAGIVVLGGATEHEHTRAGNDQPQLNDAAERLTAAAALAHAHPRLRVLHTGAFGTLVGQRIREGEQAAQFFREQGIAPERVLLEQESRTTAENAALAATLPGVDRRDRWLLLTSAWHMPRSVAAFEKAGWNVTPYPIDYRAGGAVRWSEYNLWRSLQHWQMAIHETLGLLAYRAAGRA